MKARWVWSGLGDCEDCSSYTFTDLLVVAGSTEIGTTSYITIQRNGF